MVYSFSTPNWAQEIADESEKEEYQTARIRLTNPALITRIYNETTGKYEVTGDGIVYEGQVRIIPVRWGTFSGGESQANATTLSAIRVQMPRTAQTNVRANKGFKVLVTESPYSPGLVNRLFTVTSDLQGSSSASRTFECDSDIDAKVTTT